MHQPQQLPLGVTLNDDARFDNFYISPQSNNGLALRAVAELLAPEGEDFVAIWGQSAVGLSHLAQALCHAADTAQQAVQYLPLRSLLPMANTTEDAEALLAGLEHLDVVCLDDVDCAVGNGVWEQALFHLFNRLRDNGVRLLITAHQNPQHLAIELADLKSRLQWGLNCNLQPLTDADKSAALQLRAKVRGLQLTDEVAAYILQRAPRDMAQLFGLLAELDKASLRDKRKLTIPFVRQFFQA